MQDLEWEKSVRKFEKFPALMYDLSGHAFLLSCVQQDLLKKGTRGWKKITKIFRREILAEHEQVNRAQLGELSLFDSNKRKKNSIIDCFHSRLGSSAVSQEDRSAVILLSGGRHCRDSHTEGRRILHGMSREWLERRRGPKLEEWRLRGVGGQAVSSTTFAGAQASIKPPFEDERRPRQAKSKTRRSWRENAEVVGAGGGSGLTYKDAGVDIDAGSELVRRIAALTPGIGGFGGLFPLGDSYLVAGTDGVGTKLKLAFELDVHDTIGIDLVAMSVNDIVTSGAKPLFFLDYFATSRLDVDQAEQVVKGIVDGCRQSDCVLLGGETAEMPDFYAEGEYDLSGFAVGIVKKDALIDGKNIMVGDQIIGLASSGVHSNGFSLVRRVLAKSGASLQDSLPGADGISIGEALLAPTVIYVKQVLELLAKGGVKGIAHITGGGFTDNIPRIFPSGLGAFVKVGAWNVPPIFKWLQKAGGVEEAEMFRTFNMGIGMILVVTSDAANDILSTHTNATLLGHVADGEGVIYSK